MRTDSLLLPGAIVIGCGLIGLGLYFGLRASAPASTAPEPEAATAPSAPVAGTRTERSVRSDDAVRRRVEQAARAAIEAEKQSRYLPECWKPAIAANPEPATSKHVLALGFDAEGRENLRGLNDLRGQSRTDVSNCLQKIPMGIRVTPPPGIPVSVEIPIEFP